MEEKKPSWWSKHKPTKRRVIQLLAALLVNCNIKGFVSGTIFTGKTKYACVPGMNCYSCPGAVGACPIGSVQSALADANKSTLFYVLGIILVYGLILGRTLCSHLCPFGLIEDLLYKIKSFKIKKGKITRALSYLKYVILFGFVFLITIGFAIAGAAVPAFCKYICPVGTIEGAFTLPFYADNVGFLDIINILFTWKTGIALIIIILSILMYRPFCRFLCPMGALMSFFSKVNLVGVEVIEDKCTNCGACVTTCKMDINHVGDHECINCGECINVCPSQAIQWKSLKSLFKKANETGKPVGEILNEEIKMEKKSND